jgi:hypothetical protein
VLQFYSNTINAFEANRRQANNAIDGLQAQQIDQLNQVIVSTNSQIGVLVADVTLARAQLATDVSNGATLQQQFEDFVKIQTTGQAALTGSTQIAQLQAAAIQHTSQQLQFGEQLRFAITQMITQQEQAFTTALLPAILQAVSQPQPPDVGPALVANATVIYSGTFQTESGTTPGENILYTTGLAPVVTVGADGVTLSGAGSAQLMRLIEITSDSQTFQATSVAVSGSLAAPNSNQAKGFFSVTYDQGLGNVVYPWAGSIGHTKIVGQITDPLSGVTTPFTLNMVPPP